MQGGVFSDRGHLYLVNGYQENFNRYKGGIWVFHVDGNVATLVDHSNQEDQPGTFEFQYHPWHTPCHCCTCVEEPEGIDIGRSLVSKILKYLILSVIILLPVRGVKADGPDISVGTGFGFIIQPQDQASVGPQREASRGVVFMHMPIMVSVGYSFSPFRISVEGLASFPFFCYYASAIKTVGSGGVERGRNGGPQFGKSVALAFRRSSFERSRG